MHVDSEKYAKHVVDKLIFNFERTKNLNEVHRQVKNLLLRHPRLEEPVLRLLGEHISIYKIKRDIDRQRIENKRAVQRHKKLRQGKC